MPYSLKVGARGPSMRARGYFPGFSGITGHLEASGTGGDLPGRIGRGAEKQPNDRVDDGTDEAEDENREKYRKAEERADEHGGKQRYPERAETNPESDEDDERDEFHKSFAAIFESFAKEIQGIVKSCDFFLGSHFPASHAKATKKSG
jgi:hypothetical protein